MHITPANAAIASVLGAGTVLVWRIQEGTKVLDHMPFPGKPVHVFTDRKRVEKLRYIHRNPVARGLALVPEEWKWSSFRQWYAGKRGIVEVDSNWMTPVTR
jgi:hypothetical protein